LDGKRLKNSYLMRKRQKSEKTRRSSSLLIIIAVLLLISIFGLYFPNSIVVVSSIIIALILILLEITSSGKRNYFDRNEANKKDSEEQQDDENNSEEKMIYIGTIAAGLAHEVRNPLNAIDFNIRMIQEDLESGEWEKDDIKERFSSTYKEIKHLERLVSDFLLYARKMALQIGETDIISLLNSTKAMLVEEVSKRKIDIIIESD
jgi:signal transduction histidine kinase